MVLSNIFVYFCCFFVPILPVFLLILHFNLCWPSLIPSKFIVLKDTYVYICLKYTEETQSCKIILYTILCASKGRHESTSFINKIPGGVSQMCVKDTKHVYQTKKKEKIFCFQIVCIYWPTVILWNENYLHFQGERSDEQLLCIITQYFTFMS